MSAQYKHYDGQKNFQTTYNKGEKNPPHTCQECTCKFIKPRTSYDKMLKTFITEKSIDLPNLEKYRSNWK